MLGRKLYRETYVTHIAQAHSVPSLTSKMKPFVNMENYFSKRLCLRVGKYGGGLRSGKKFQLVKP